MDAEIEDFFFTPRIPLPNGHTCEIVTTVAVEGGFVTKDRLGIVRAWNKDGFPAGILPPMAAVDMLIFPSIGGKFLCVASNTGELRVYRVAVPNGETEQTPPPASFDLFSTGKFWDDPAISWIEVLTCAYAAEDAREVFVGTSGGLVYGCTFDPEIGIYAPLPAGLRRNDGFSCRGITRDENANLFVVLQNGYVEQINVRDDQIANKACLDGSLGLVRVSQDHSQFAAVRLAKGEIVGYEENETIIVCGADGDILHELHASFIGAIAFAGDKLIVGSDEDGLIEYNLTTLEISPLFEDEAWPEEFTVTSIALLPAASRIAVAGVDPSINNVVLQFWDGEGLRMAEESHPLETISVMVPGETQRDAYFVGTTNGGIWRGNAANLTLPQFASVPKSVEAVQILSVGDGRVLFLGTLDHLESDLDEFSSIIWLIDLQHPEQAEELQVYEPIVGGFYDPHTGVAQIFSRGEIYAVNLTDWEITPINQMYATDDPDLVVSSVTHSQNSDVVYVGTEQGEVWEFVSSQPGQKIVDREQHFGPIETLIVTSQGAPLLLAGFYRVIGIYWPQNAGFTRINELHTTVNSIAPHPAWPLFAAGGNDSQIYLFDFNGNKLGTVPPRQSKVIGLFWQSTEEIVVAYASGEVGTWDVSALDIIRHNRE